MTGKDNDIEKFEVEYPEEGVIRNQTEMILNKAIPKKNPVSKRIRLLLTGPGLRVVFYKSYLTMICSLAFYAVFFWAYLEIERWVEYKQYLVIMIFPIMNLAFMALSSWSEEQLEIVQLKQTFKYSFTYITSLRLFYVSIVSVIVNATTLLNVVELEHVGKIGVIGFSSMFVFASLSLYLVDKFGRCYNIIWLAAVWCLACIGLSQYGGAVSYILFDVIPLVVHAVIAFLCFEGFIIYMRKVEKRNAYTYEY